jgi:hypothetical protein
LLQVVWHQPVDIDAALAVVDCMLGGLAAPSPRKKRES